MFLTGQKVEIMTFLSDGIFDAEKKSTKAKKSNHLRLNKSNGMPQFIDTAWMYETGQASIDLDKPK